MDEQSWGDMGTGRLRLMKHATNGSRRLILRNDMGKVREISCVLHDTLHSYPVFLSNLFIRGPDYVQ